jgi:hypothetical protein
MANRNFDFSAIVNILKSQNAGNFYNRQQRLVNTISTVPAQIQVQPANPQTANSDADTVPTIRAGQQAYYFKNGTTTTIMSPQNYLPMPTVPTIFTILVFSTVGTTSWKAPLLTNTLTYLVVGGGGGGGNGYDTGGGGGGGAGMVLTGTLAVVPDTIYTVTIGSGGAGGAATRTDLPGSPGDPSVFGSVTALGGGFGNGSRAQPGGAGTGGAAQTTTAAVGGAGGGSLGSGGGGGGASGAGGNGNAGAGGAAGAGLASSLSGSSITYGVGGAGAKGNTIATGADGTANTGNGGGGGGYSSNGASAGGTGGSGIVVITFFQ